MWQRIQTVFLLISIISLILGIFFPIWTFHQADGTLHQLYALHYSQIESGEKITLYFPYSLVAIFTTAAATLAIIEIGKFKNRLLQIKLGALNSLILVVVMAGSVYFASQLAETYPGGKYGFGLYLPGIAVIGNLLANRFIRRDEKLVREADRLR